MFYICRYCVFYLGRQRWGIDTRQFSRSSFKSSTLQFRARYHNVDLLFLSTSFLLIISLLPIWREYKFVNEQCIARMMLFFRSDFWFDIPYRPMLVTSIWNPWLIPELSVTITIHNWNSFEESTRSFNLPVKLPINEDSSLESSPSPIRKKSYPLSRSNAMNLTQIRSSIASIAVTIHRQIKSFRYKLGNPGEVKFWVSFTWRNNDPTPHSPGYWFKFRENK